MNHKNSDFSNLFQINDQPYLDQTNNIKKGNPKNQNSKYHADLKHSQPSDYHQTPNFEFEENSNTQRPLLLSNKCSQPLSLKPDQMSFAGQAQEENKQESNDYAQPPFLKNEKFSNLTEIVNQTVLQRQLTQKHKSMAIMSPCSKQKQVSRKQLRNKSSHNSTMMMISDKTRANQVGKILMVPSLKSVIETKNQEKNTEAFKQKFQQECENKAQCLDMVEIEEGEVSGFHTPPDTPPKDKLKVEAGLKEQQKEFIKSSLNSQNLQTSSFQKERRMSKDEIISPIKLGNHQVHIFKQSQRVSALFRNNQEFLDKFKGMQQIQQKEREKIEKRKTWRERSKQRGSVKRKDDDVKSLSAKAKGSSKRFQNVKLDPNQEEQDNKYKNFAINRHQLSGTVFAYSTKMIKDQDLFDFLLTQMEENITKFSISNGQITDSGIVVLCDYFQRSKSLQKLKLYNNIMFALLNGQDVPYLMCGTEALAKCFQLNTKLQSLELHGFFLHPSFFSNIIDSLCQCSNLKVVSFSNNNIQDGGVCEIIRLIDNYEMDEQLPLESLTIYNNNITDEGAKKIAQAMEGHKTMRILNLQMNFIKDMGGNAFLEGLGNEQYVGIWKIILLDNQCSENFKRKAKKFDVIVV